MPSSIQGHPVVQVIRWCTAAHRMAIVVQPTGEARQKSRVAATWTRPYVRGPFSSSVRSPVRCRGSACLTNPDGQVGTQDAACKGRLVGLGGERAQLAAEAFAVGAVTHQQLHGVTCRWLQRHAAGLPI